MTRPSLTPEQERLLAERDHCYSDDTPAFAEAMRLKACGGDRELYLQKEMERLDVLFAPLRKSTEADRRAA